MPSRLKEAKCGFVLKSECGGPGSTVGYRGPEGEKESDGRFGDGPGIMGVPSEKNGKGHLTWNQRKRSQVRPRSRPGTPSGVEEETWLSEWQSGGGAATGKALHRSSIHE